MSKSNSFENALLLLLFNNTSIAKIGDATGIPGSTTTGNLYVRLYTDAVAVDDGTVGTECAYTGYVAKGVAVARTTGGWAVLNNNASNAAVVTFGACVGGTENIRYFAIWKDDVSAVDADRIYWGTLTADLAVSNGITPEFGIGVLDINED